MAPARLSQELTGWPSGLTPAPYPVAPASGPALAADPSPWDALPRAPASLLSASGARRGPASARGRGDQCAAGTNCRELNRFAACCGAVPSTSPRSPPASPLSPILSGRRKAVVLGSDSGEIPPLPGTPDGWAGKEKRGDWGGAGAVVREIPGVGWGMR